MLQKEKSGNPGLDLPFADLHNISTLTVRNGGFSTFFRAGTQFRTSLNDCFFAGNVVFKSLRSQQQSGLPDGIFSNKEP
jgi:hypothetical protein